MTYPLITLLNEIKARMDKCKSDGNLECKEIFIGDFEQNRKISDYPIMVIAPISTRVVAECMQYGVYDDCRIAIVYIIPKKTDNINKLYKNGDTSGSLYELAKILNYLEKKTSDGSIDLTLNATTHSLAVPDVSFNYSHSDLVRMTITVTVRAGEYLRGAR